MGLLINVDSDEVDHEGTVKSVVFTSNFVWPLREYVKNIFLTHVHGSIGVWGSVVVKALRYKSEGQGIDSKR